MLIAFGYIHKRVTKYTISRENKVVLQDNRHIGVLRKTMKNATRPVAVTRRLTHSHGYHFLFIFGFVCEVTKNMNMRAECGPPPGMSNNKVNQECTVGNMGDWSQSPTVLHLATQITSMYSGQHG